MVARSVHLTGLDDHDRRSGPRRVERDLVGPPLGVLVRGRRRRCRPMTLRDDRAMRVAEGRDRGDVQDPRGPRESPRLEHAAAAAYGPLLPPPAAVPTATRT